MTRRMTSMPAANTLRLPQAVVDQADRIVSTNLRSAEFITQAHHIAMRTSQSLVKRQAAVLQETFDEMQSLVRGMNLCFDVDSAGAVQQECIQSVIGRTLEHLRIALACTQDINRVSLDLMAEQLEALLSGTTDIASDSES